MSRPERRSKRDGGIEASPGEVAGRIKRKQDKVEETEEVRPNCMFQVESGRTREQDEQITYTQGKSSKCVYNRRVAKTGKRDSGFEEASGDTKHWKTLRTTQRNCTQQKKKRWGDRKAEGQYTHFSRTTTTFHQSKETRTVTWQGPKRRTGAATEQTRD